MNLPLAAAPAHHIPPHVANALGWAVVVIVIAAVLAVLLKALKIL